MPQQETIGDRDAFEHARRIAALEARGAWQEAIEAWRRLIAQAPAFLPARLGLAQALIRTARPDDALPVLQELTVRAPTAPGPWLALAVACSMLNRHDEAIAAAERAATSAPAHAAVHLGLGDVMRVAGRTEGAEAAYARAVALAPEDVDALNKLATMRRALRDRKGAEALLRRALALDPRHPYVRVNAATLALALGRHDEGRRELLRALDDPSLPPDARHEATDALATLDESDALAPAIASGIATSDPGPIESALRARPRGVVADARLIGRLTQMVDRYAGGSGHADVARGSPTSAAWGAIEAHHHFLATRTRDAIAQSVDLVASEPPERSVSRLDIVRYARLVDLASAVPFDEHDPIAFEAAYRWTHAQLTHHRPDVGPGLLRPGSYLEHAIPGSLPSPPRRMQATLDVVLRDLAPRLPAGHARAALLHMALVLLQPFADGNTRAARFVQNRMLERAGHFPSLRPADGDRSLMAATRNSGDLEPMIDSLVAGSIEASERDREWRTPPA